MSFDILAPHYRWMEFVSAGNKLQRCRTAFLGRVAAANILILGEGNGRFLLECRRQLPEANITIIDASAKMLARARQRLKGQGTERINFICADALTWTPTERAFDLIVTHFFLDCFRPEQLEVLTATLARAAAPRANWLLADFQSAPRGCAHYRSEAILWLMYRFFCAVTKLPARTLTPPGPYLQRHGFELRAREVYDWGLLHSDRWQMANDE